MKSTVVRIIEIREVDSLESILESDNTRNSANRFLPHGYTKKINRISNFLRCCFSSICELEYSAIGQQIRVNHAKSLFDLETKGTP